MRSIAAPEIVHLRLLSCSPPNFSSSISHHPSPITSSLTLVYTHCDAPSTRNLRLWAIPDDPGNDESTQDDAASVLEDDPAAAIEDDLTRAWHTNLEKLHYCTMSNKCAATMSTESGDWDFDRDIAFAVDSLLPWTKELLSSGRRPSPSSFKDFRWIDTKAPGVYACLAIKRESAGNILSKARQWEHLNEKLSREYADTGSPFHQYNQPTSADETLELNWYTTDSTIVAAVRAELCCACQGPLGRVWCSPSRGCIVPQEEAEDRAMLNTFRVQQRLNIQNFKQQDHISLRLRHTRADQAMRAQQDEFALASAQQDLDRLMLQYDPANEADAARRADLEEQAHQDELARQRIQRQQAAQAEADRLAAEQRAEADRAARQRQAELERANAARQAELQRVAAARQAQADRLAGAQEAENQRRRARDARQARLARQKPSSDDVCWH
ncbi:hypothetical protein KCU65_g3268, partial [Aureobasidium melanogenum]